MVFLILAFLGFLLDIALFFPFHFSYMRWAPLAFLISSGFICTCAWVWFPALLVLGYCLHFFYLNLVGATCWAFWRRRRRAGKFAANFIWAYLALYTLPIISLIVEDYFDHYISIGNFQSEDPFFMICTSMVFPNLIVLVARLGMTIFDYLFKFFNK